MKRAKLLLLVCLVASTVFNSSANHKIKLADAVSKKIIRIEINGLGHIERSNNSSHFGKCMAVKMTNLGNSELEVELEAGRLLVPDDSRVQNMLVTQTMVAHLHPRQTQKLQAYAMCSEHFDLAPDPNYTFTMGRMSEGNILKLARLLEENRIQNKAGQQALWALTDNLPLTDIKSDDPYQQKLLLKFVSNATSKPIPSFDQFANHNNYYIHETREIFKVSCWLDFEVMKQSTVSIILYDNNGRMVKEFMHPVQTKPGAYNKTITLSSTEFPLGEYILKIQIGNESTLNRKLVIGEHLAASDENEN